MNLSSVISKTQFSTFYPVYNDGFKSSFGACYFNSGSFCQLNFSVKTNNYIIPSLLVAYLNSQNISSSRNFDPYPHVNILVGWRKAKLVKRPITYGLLNKKVYKLSIIIRQVTTTFQ